MLVRGTTDRRRLLSIGLIALVIVLTVIAASLAVGVLGRATAPVGVGASPSGSRPSGTEAPTAAASLPAAPAEATARPTTAASATPDPEPQAVLKVDSWVRADVQLNMRRELGLSAGLRALLEPGQVVLVVEGPLPADGFDWYRVIAPVEHGGGSGWIASGPEADPYASVISSDRVLRTCGTVQAGGVVAGLRFWWSLDEVEAAIFDLLVVTDGEACVTLERSSEAVAVYVEASVTACGEPRWEQDDAWLLPSVAGDVVAEAQVMQRVRVDQSLLTTNAVLDADGLSNRHRVLGLASEADPPFACVHARVTETLSGRDSYFMTDSLGCFLIEEATDGYALLRSDPDGTLFKFERRAGGGYSYIDVGAWSLVNVTAMYSRSDGQFMGLHGQTDLSGQGYGCAP